MARKIQACCKGCIYYRPLSRTYGWSQLACHHILDTGKRNGRAVDGLSCTTRKEAKHAKKRIPAAAEQHSSGE